MCGPARTVVWEGERREAPPIPIDLLGLPLGPQAGDRGSNLIDDDNQQH